MPSPKEFLDFSSIAKQPEHNQGQERREYIQEILKEAGDAVTYIRHEQGRVLQYAKIIATAKRFGISAPAMTEKAKVLAEKLPEGREATAVRATLERAERGEEERKEEEKKEDIDGLLNSLQGLKRKSEAQYQVQRIAGVLHRQKNMTEEQREKLSALARELGMMTGKESSILLLLNLGGVHIDEAMTIVDATKRSTTGKESYVIKNEDRIQYKVLALPERVQRGELLEVLVQEVREMIKKISPDPHGHFQAARLGSLADALMELDLDPRPTLRIMMESYKKPTGDYEQTTLIGWVVDRYIAYAKKE